MEVLHEGPVGRDPIAVRVNDTTIALRRREAMAILRFMQSPHARTIAKAVRSAAANAENNYNMDPRHLQITRAFVGDGVKMRRMTPRARGRADIIIRRRSNITIIVEEGG